MISESKVVAADTPTLILDTYNFEQHVYIHNNHSNKMYIGGSNVSASNGLHLDNGEMIEIRIPQDNFLYALSESTAGNISILRPR